MPRRHLKVMDTVRCWVQCFFFFSLWCSFTSLALQSKSMSISLGFMCLFCAKKNKKRIPFTLTLQPLHTHIYVAPQLGCVFHFVCNALRPLNRPPTSLAKKKQFTQSVFDVIQVIKFVYVSISMHCVYIPFTSRHDFSAMNLIWTACAYFSK